MSITFKPSRLTKVLETNTNYEMAKSKNKAGAAAAQPAAVEGPTATTPVEKRRGVNNADIRSFLEAAVAGGQVTRGS